MQGAWQGVVKKNAAVGGWGGGRGGLFWDLFEVRFRKTVFGVFEESRKKTDNTFLPQVLYNLFHMAVLPSYFCFPSALKTKRSTWTYV
jgi:hypothetical protein